MPRKRRFLKRKILGLLILAYLLFANSCMTMRTSQKQTVQYFKDKGITFKEGNLEIQARNLHYIQTGQEDAPTLVFIHGSPGSWDAYKAYLADSILTAQYRVIAPDRPGFGKSEFRKSMALQPQAEILNQFLKQLDNGQPYTLIGHSYGGPLIVQMALDQPELYQNLVVLAGALDPNAEKPEKWRKPLTWFPLKYLVPGALKPSNDELWMLKDDLKILESRLKSLAQRTLIIHGTEDNLVPYQNVPFMEKRFSNVDSIKVIPIENENHFIVWNQEKLVKQSILDWVRSR
ncbi:alpha/beta fold hydrolase [Flagellimonas flava]|uniref:Pimeloyl-ACP methyl ester carboxylesterase n=1 Tax=Flagellimonas flava TaxID=570519 RepID=A0A1M5IIX6_9FLAO|nr:alpha/beta hydrolase [Allomuricauda flava]SHG27999.1 Pimeloyl-ACP methyl ester carboxylesterase [Allomuricauda flava]